MHSNRDNKQPASRISRLDPPTLQHTCGAWIVDGALGHPVQTEQERSRLLKIDEQELVDENDVLVVRERSFVVAFPEDKAVGQEREETECCNERDEATDAHSDETGLGRAVEGLDNMGLSGDEVVLAIQAMVAPKQQDGSVERSHGCGMRRCCRVWTVAVFNARRQVNPVPGESGQCMASSFVFKKENTLDHRQACILEPGTAWLLCTLFAAIVGHWRKLN